MKKLLSKNKGTEIINSFNKARVMVVGDLIMDHFIWGDVKRISPEAPVPVVDVKNENVMLGGAANVVNNVRALGGKCMLAGIAGKDSDGRKLLKLLKEIKVDTKGVILDSKRPTTIKTRIIAANQQVVRFDREDKTLISGKLLDKVKNYIKDNLNKTDVIVISDYAKGIITKSLAHEIIEMAKKKNIPVVVDPKIEHFSYYSGATVITPNNKEAGEAAGIDITDNKTLFKAEKEISRKIDVDSILITRGSKGMSLFSDNKDTHIQTLAKEVYDVSGAGDTVVSALALSLATKKASMVEASVIANCAAGVVVGKLGTATLSIEELKNSIKEIK